MNAILFYNYLNGIHGGVLDFIEFYLCMLEQNSDVKMLIINYNQGFRKALTELIYDRYDVSGLDFEKNIIGIDCRDLLRIKFNRLLVHDYGTIYKVRGLVNIINNESKIFVVSELHTDNPKYVIDKSLYPEDCVVYYGEMPFVYKDVHYNHKFLFSRYKPLQRVDSAIFLHSPNSNDYGFIKNYKSIFGNRRIVFKTSKHKNNLFELFDTFVYFHADKWFDPRPRLMHECFFYGKEIVYINEPGCVDGSHFRYNDLMNNGISNRYLTKDDEIVREFI